MHRTRFVLATLVALFVCAAPRSVRADEPFETANWPKNCRALEEKNEKEIAAFTKEQAPTKYVFPREDTVLGAPWGKLLKGALASGGVLLATVLPHAGAQLRGESPAAHISWPLSIPFGPGYSCSRKEGTFAFYEHRASRLVIEPAVVSSNRGVGFSTRPGYRWIHHPTDWVVGVGGGLGSTIEIAGNSEPFRPSFSIEALAHFGKCCSPSYFMLTLRYDRFFIGRDLDIVGLNLGYTYF